MKTEFFNDNFLDALSDDPLIALETICQEFQTFSQKVGDRADYHEDYLSALAIFKALAEARGYELKPPSPSPGANAGQNINNIRNFFSQNEGRLIEQLHSVYVERESQKYAARFEADSVYVFPENDYKRIQELINEMRQIVSESKVIPEKHKRRLIERLERMQRELHKKTSDLDRFWGFIGESGIAIGKFGNDIKPFIDRVRELTDIVKKAIQIKEKLSGTYNPILLPDPNSDEPLAT
jgi:hypothetical protein